MRLHLNPDGSRELRDSTLAAPSCDSDCDDCDRRDECFQDPDTDYPKDNPGSCGNFGEILYKPGTEMCEFCPVSDECQRLTRNWMKRTRGGTNP